MRRGINHLGGALKAGQRGAALLLVLVLVVVLATLVASVVGGRQAGAATMRKQLDRVSMESVVKGDSERYLARLRVAYREAAATYGSLSLSSVTLGGGAFGGIVDEGVDGNMVFSPAGNYPNFALGTITAPVVFSAGSYRVSAVDLDPYGGMVMDSLVSSGSLGMEMQGSERELRDGRFSNAASKLRGWDSLDGELDVALLVRSFPVSAFTVFSPEGGSGGVDLNSSWMVQGAGSLSYPSASSLYDASIGIGRCYVEGTVKVSEAFELGLPLVATGGLEYPCATVSGLTPNTRRAFGGAPASYEEYLKNRRGRLGGMLLTEADGPMRLIRAGEQYVGGKWSMPDGSLANVSTGYGKALAEACVWVQVSVPGGVVSVASYNGSRFKGDDAGQVNKLIDGSVFSVDTIRKEVLYSPPALFYDQFDLAPIVVGIKVVKDADSSVADDYRVRVRCGSVAGLSATNGKKKMTLFVPYVPLLVESGFNTTGSDEGVMVVGPKVMVSSAAPSSGGGSFSVNAVVLTEGVAVDGCIYGEDSSDVVTVKGGVVLWSRSSAAKPGTRIGVKISPDAELLTGERRLPEVVPAVVDVRYASRFFRLYPVFKTDASVIVNSY